MSALPVVSEIRHNLETLRPQFAMALPRHIDAQKFERVAMTAINANPDLLAADRKTLFGACMRAAQDGLLPDGREGALVVFKGRVQWMPMIAGILKRVRQSGELLSIAAHVVHARDEFAYRLGDHESIDHVPYLDGERGPPRLVYAIAKTKDGGVYREIMTLEEIEQVRAVSRARDGGPWSTWWGEMAKKTVLRRLAKRLPMATDADELLRREEDAETEVPALPPSPVADLNARLRPPVWPRKDGDDWVDVDGTVFDPMSHAWSNEGQCPSVTGEGRFRARRGTRQARATDPVETPAGEALDGGQGDEG